MHRLAVIAAPHAWPAHWAMSGFEVEHLPAVTALAPDARFDGIALVQPAPGEVAATLQQLKLRDPLGAVATLMAGRGDSAEALALLEQHEFDGFLDLGWPERLAAASVRIAVGHVELGRNLVDIQRVVIQQARQQMTSLYELANHDGLTNLFNHRYFAGLMERQHERSHRLGESYALVFLDLDDLKQLNTRYGHAGGSLALNELARLIAASIRGTDVAVRLGGDEFAIFLAGCDQAQGAEFARRLCSRLHAHHFEFEGQPMAITVSCGVAAYPEDGLKYSDLLKHADDALLHAKAEGKDRVVGFAATRPQTNLTQ